VTAASLRVWVRRSRITARMLTVVATLAAFAPWQRLVAQADDGRRAPVLLGTVLDAVARSNPRLDAARALARAARARVPGVTRPPDPQLQFGFMNYELPSLRPMDALGMTQLQLMQMVPVAGKLRLAGAVATARADAASTRIADAGLDLRARTAMSFYDLYAVDGALRVAMDTRRLLQDLAVIADRMYQVGEGRQADVLRAKVELARMQEEIVRMQTMRTTMQARLNALLVLPAGTPIGAPQLPIFPVLPPTLDSLTGIARPCSRARRMSRSPMRVSNSLAARSGPICKSAYSTASSAASWARNGWGA
jgi:hypothetical protein